MSVPEPSRIVCEFRGKITTIDGTRYVRIPALTARHAVTGERIYVTDGAVKGRADLLHVNDRLAPLDSPRLTHVSGEFIATVRVDLGTHKAYREAQGHKGTENRAWYNAPRDERGEGLLEMEERVHAEVLAIFAAHDPAAVTA